MKINVKIDKNENLDNALDDLCKFINLLAQKHQLNYFETYGLVECLKIELNRAIDKLEDE